MQKANIVAIIISVIKCFTDFRSDTLLNLRLGRSLALLDLMCPTRKVTSMHQEIEWLEAVAPDLLDTMTQRFAILKNIAKMQPVGRRSLALKLNLSERVLRTETDFLKKQGLVSVAKLGMSLTSKGQGTLQGLSEFMEQFLGIQQLERQLATFLGIERCLIAKGDSNSSPKVVTLMGYLLNDALKTALPKGKNIIAAMGGTTMAQVATCMTDNLSLQRELIFVPARGGISERVDIQANNICAQMALNTGGKHRVLYVPEQVSEDTYYPLLQEPSVQEVITLINQSNVALHSVGEAVLMAKRRSMPTEIIEMLQQKHAVAEAFGYFFDEAGKVVYKIPRIGLQLEDLASMDCVFAVAGGHLKAKAIVAYMKHAPKQTCLITDQGAAKAILKGNV